MSEAMTRLLKHLDGQTKIAAEYPGAYSPHLTIGHAGCHKATAEALIRRGLADVVIHRMFGRCVAINDAGRKVIAPSEQGVLS